MLAEENLWTFDRNDFEKACLFLMLENTFYRDGSALQMRELISKHFTSENELALWSKDICEKVILAINRWKVCFFVLSVKLIEKRPFRTPRISRKAVFILLSEPRTKIKIVCPASIICTRFTKILVRMFENLEKYKDFLRNSSSWFTPTKIGK